MLKSALFMLLPALVWSTAAAAGPQASQAKQGDQLLIQRIHQEKQLNLPTRGMTMAQVERTYGAPTRKLQPRGGDTPKHPLIKRWEYSDYIVYFEHGHVIHTVLNTPAGNNRHPQRVQ